MKLVANRRFLPSVFIEHAVDEDRPFGADGGQLSLQMRRSVVNRLGGRKKRANQNKNSGKNVSHAETKALDFSSIEPAEYPSARITMSAEPTIAHGSKDFVSRDAKVAFVDLSIERSPRAGQCASSRRRPAWNARAPDSEDSVSRAHARARRVETARADHPRPRFK